MSWYLAKPLKTTKLAKTSKAFDGTPVQCLGIGLDQICFYRFSTVVSAIVFRYFQSVSFCHIFYAFRLLLVSYTTGKFKLY